MSEHSPTPSRPASPLGPLPVLPQTAQFRFNWERRKGPASISETTEGRAHDPYNSLPHVDLPNAAIYNLASLHQDWSSSSQGFNAISNVLNSPHKSQAPPKAHSSLPSVPLAVLPRVKRKDFDPYLRAIAPEWDRFVQSTNPPNDGLDSSTSGTSSEIPFTPRTPRFTRLLTPLNTVPFVFFQPNFDLGNSATFDAVTERKDGDQHASDPSSLSYSLPLLEKLSHHADTIEQHLVREISVRSTSFFAALTNLQDLQTESEQCLDRISKLRGLLNDLDENGAKRGLEIVRKESRLLNLAAVIDGTRELGAVVEMKGVARGLVGAGQWGEALDMIHSIETLWNPPPPDAPPKLLVRRRSRQTDGALSPLPPTPESPSLEEEGSSKCSTAPSIALSSLAAFSSLPSHLQAMNIEITSSLATDLVVALKADLLDRVNTNADSSRPPTEMNLTLKDRLRPLVHGLLQTNGIREATASWREVVTVEIKGLIQQHLPSFDSDEDEKNSRGGMSALPGLLRSMAQPEFSSIVSRVYMSFIKGIEGLQIQNGILIDVLESQKSMPASPDVPPIQAELSDILSSSADLSNKLVAKAIGYRSEQHAQLDLPSFLLFFNQSWDFVIKCEVICRRMIMGLRGVILGQAKLFLQSFHQSRINQSAKLVEDEQWNQMEVPSAVQRAADVLVDSAVRDSPDLVIGRKLQPQSPPSPRANGAASPTPGKANGSVAPSKYIRIEDRPYFCVSATGAVLELLLEYLKLVVNLPMLNTDTMSRVIEFLKAFNSRTCQVVLGAGAMRSAGLRNITAKHLALASQSLSIMVALIPYVRETFRRHLSPNQAVMLVEFDKLKRDFQEHQNEIHSKLIAIMGDRISAHVKSLQAINWETPRVGDGVNDYMELLIKETVTLHKVLSRYLSSPIVEYVMSQVFAAINHRLSEEYAKIELQSQEAKDRMQADAQFLHQKLSVLKNVSAPTNMLETLVSEKAVPRKSALGNFRATGGPNERIRGILSRRDSSKPEKPLPSPVPAPLSLPLPISDSVDELGEDPDRVIPPPRGSSRSPGLLQGHMGVGSPTPSDSKGLRGNTSQGDGASQEASEPVSSPPPSTDVTRDSVFPNEGNS